MAMTNRGLPRWARGALAAACLCVAAGCATRASGGDPVPAGIVSVTHADIARFDQGRGAPPESREARRAWVDALSLHLADRAAPRLRKGEQLEVEITDVQRAGGFEPWRGPQTASLRIVRDIYPPRIDLSFKLLDERGAVLREGRRQLRDTAFMMHPDLYPNDPLRHEKALLDDWIAREFRP